MFCQSTRPVLVMTTTLLLGYAAAAQDSSLPDYFGFSSVDVIKIGDDPGPMMAADLNGDGLQDLLVLNNHDSRIDVLYQKHDPSPDMVEPPTRTNELPDHWRYRRETIPLADYANAMRTLDVDGDGDLDILYAGRGRIVFLMQDSSREVQEGTHPQDPSTRGRTGLVRAGRRAGLQQPRPREHRRRKRHGVAAGRR